MHMADEGAERTLSNLRRRRGAVRGSITRLGGRLKDLEGAADRPDVGVHAKQLASRLDTLDSDFKTLHFQIVDLISDENAEELGKEQDALDKYEDDVSSLSVRLHKLLEKSHSPSNPGNRKALLRKLLCLESNLKSTETFLKSLPAPPDDLSLVDQHRERLTDHKTELAAIYDDLLSLDLEEGDDLFALHVRLEKLLFECSHQAKRQLSLSSKPATSPAVDSRGVKLPKLDVPVFDGDILNWRQFWEQFSVSVHDRTSLSDVEKLVYLQHAIKSGEAKGAIEGLSRSGDNYREAIDCLRSRYDRPRLIHRAHVQKIMCAPALKDGNGKELRRLHDVIQQHMRALKAMKHEPSSSFLTSVIELKLDVDTMFEWQKHSQANIDVPHYQDLLEFLDLRAQASETTVSGSS